MITSKLINYVMAGVECATNQAKLGLTKEIPIVNNPPLQIIL